MATHPWPSFAELKNESALRWRCRHPYANRPILMNSNELAAALLESSPDGLLLVSGDGVIRVANPSASRIFGYEVDVLVGTDVERLVPDEFRRGHHLHRERFANDPTSRPMGSGLELFAQHADGSLVPVEISLSPVILDGAPHTIATVRDITERQRSVAQVLLLRDRERIARDLHDMVIQRLFAAGMSLQAVSEVRDRSVVDARIAQTIDDLDDTIRELRKAIFALGKPSGRHRLTEVLTELVAARTGQLGFEPQLRIEGDFDVVPSNVAEHLIATVTEALSNIARHAQASSAAIEIVCEPKQLRLTVTDDGVGIQRTDLTSGGLSNMLSRAADLGGTGEVGSGPESGTEVSWSVPM
jgi:two-component system sensor histidine kinase DevS